MTKPSPPRTSGKWAVLILLLAIAAVALAIRWGVKSQAGPTEEPAGELGW